MLQMQVVERRTIVRGHRDLRAKKAHYARNAQVQELRRIIGLGAKFRSLSCLLIDSSEKSYKCLKSPKNEEKSKIHTGVRGRAY